MSATEVSSAAGDNTVASEALERASLAIENGVVQDLAAPKTYFFAIDQWARSEDAEVQEEVQAARRAVDVLEQAKAQQAGLRRTARSLSVWSDSRREASPTTTCELDFPRFRGQITLSIEAGEVQRGAVIAGPVVGAVNVSSRLNFSRGDSSASTPFRRFVQAC